MKTLANIHNNKLSIRGDDGALVTTKIRIDNILDSQDYSGASGQILSKTTNGIEWATPENFTQGTDSVAIGTNAGNNSQSSNSVAIGIGAGTNSQSPNSVAIGVYAGNNNQSSTAVAIGNLAGNTNQSSNSVAIGNNAGRTSQSPNSVAIGIGAGKTSQSPNAVAIGRNAGFNYQRESSVAIGYSAGNTSQSPNSVAIGFGAGNTNQSQNSVAIGISAGKINQSFNSVALGTNAGLTSQSQNSVAIGKLAGTNSQSPNSVAIGHEAGMNDCGENCINIGRRAGYSNASTATNTIIINATGSDLDSSGGDRFYVKPIRNESDLTGFNSLCYNPTSGEICSNNNVLTSNYVPIPPTGGGAKKCVIRNETDDGWTFSATNIDVDYRTDDITTAADWKIPSVLAVKNYALTEFIPDFSVTRNGVGNYTITFGTTQLIHYCISLTTETIITGNGVGTTQHLDDYQIVYHSKAGTGFGVYVKEQDDGTGNGTFRDCKWDFICVARGKIFSHGSVNGFTGAKVNLLL